MVSRHTRALLAAAVLLVGCFAGASPARAHQPNQAPRHRDHVVTRARSVVGTSYRYGGSSPAGFDCSGFTSWVFSGHGAALPRSSAGQFSLGDRPGYRRVHNRNALKKGDLVFHKTTSAHVGHVGIYVGSGNFISATSSEGVQVRSLYDPYYWGQRWVGGVRLPSTMIDSSGGPKTKAKAAGKKKAKQADPPHREKPRTARREPAASGDERPEQREKKGPPNRSSTARYRPEEWRPHGRHGRP